MKKSTQHQQTYGRSIPGISYDKLEGRLIVIEGADASGRSTQVSLIQNWLERLGYAAATFGLKRSVLIAEELDRAQQGNILLPVARSLFYATDFYDQLENVIVPSLRAGMIVVADRYIYTLMARDYVRGTDKDWVRDLYSAALIPDAVFYLKVNPRNLMERNFLKRDTLDFWESGMDIGYSRNMFESFNQYQKALAGEYRRMSEQYGFISINANRSVMAAQRDLRRHLIALLDIPEERLQEAAELSPH